MKWNDWVWIGRVETVVFCKETSEYVKYNEGFKKMSNFLVWNVSNRPKLYKSRLVFQTWKTFAFEPEISLDPKARVWNWF